MWCSCNGSNRHSRVSEIFNIKYLNEYGNVNRFLGIKVIHYSPSAYEDAFFVTIEDNSVRQRVTAKFPEKNTRA